MRKNPHESYLKAQKRDQKKKNYEKCIVRYKTHTGGKIDNRIVPIDVMAQWIMRVDYILDFSRQRIDAVFIDLPTQGRHTPQFLRNVIFISYKHLNQRKKTIPMASAVK